MEGATERLDLRRVKRIKTTTGQHASTNINLCGHVHRITLIRLMQVWLLRVMERLQTRLMVARLLMLLVHPHIVELHVGSVFVKLVLSVLINNDTDINMIAVYHGVKCILA